MTSNFAIVNLRDGARRDLEPFLINNDSFPILENAYLFRGRINRRSCYQKLGTGNSRLRWQIGTTGASPFTFTLPDNPITSSIVQFSIGSVFFTDPGGASPVTLLSTDPAYSGTLNRASGAVSISHPVIAPTAVYYYPGLPVMGLRTLEKTTLNDEDLLAFDTRYSYIFSNSSQDFERANQFTTTNNTFVWEGTDSDFFWTTNYFSVLWATNNIAGLHAAVNADAPNEGDGIRWFNSADTPPGRWSNFNPAVDGTNFLLGGLIILPYKDRLVVLNTLEGATLPATRNPQRARWCQNGTPFYTNAPSGIGTDAASWRSDQVGKGGFIDAPTAEQIVSAEFIKDTLIVYFERSTWQLVYTGNPLLPFVWQKINTELGSESTFSIVPFDRGAFGVGNYGIITCDSVNVERIDQKIPDEVFQIQNKNNGVKRVYGIRDYNTQLVYWTYPIISDEDNQTTSYDLVFPNQTLVYNYLDGSWSEFDDCFTCFGYWQSSVDRTWASLGIAWETAGFAWNSQVTQAKYPAVIGGNQRGFVVVFSQIQNLGQNSPYLEISNFSSNTITCPDHNLVNGDYILITACTGYTASNGLIYKVVSATSSTFQLDPLVNATGYTGGGLITHLPNFTIVTKQFNPFYQQGDSVRLSYIDIYADKTEDGEITANFYTNSQTSEAIETAAVSTAPETATAYSSNQSRIWHRIYTNSFGSFFQNIFTLSDAQMRDLETTTSDVTIHGLIYYSNAAGRLSYDI